MYHIINIIFHKSATLVKLITFNQFVFDVFYIITSYKYQLFKITCIGVSQIMKKFKMAAKIIVYICIYFGSTWYYTFPFIYTILNRSNDLVSNLCKLALSNANSPIGCSVAQMRHAHAIYFSRNLSHNISRICICGTTRLINNFNDIVSIH